MTCFTEVALIFVDNPDPEGQGFCQAGFSVDFTKVTNLPPLKHVCVFHRYGYFLCDMMMSLFFVQKKNSSSISILLALVCYIYSTHHCFKTLKRLLHKQTHISTSSFLPSLLVPHSFISPSFRKGLWLWEDQGVSTGKVAHFSLLFSHHSILLQSLPE